MLRIVDNKWMEHLDHMDMLREGINLRAYGQRAPLVEYKIEALAMFEEMEGAIQDQIATTMYHVAVVQNEPPAQAEDAEESDETPPEPTAKDTREAESIVRREQSKVEDRLQNARASHGDETSPAESQKRAKTVDGKKIGRNDPCPCGSGKKYKNCCGRNK